MARPHDRQIRLADDVQNAPASRPQPASRIVVERRPAARLNRATADLPQTPKSLIEVVWAPAMTGTPERKLMLPSTRRTVGMSVQALVPAGCQWLVCPPWRARPSELLMWRGSRWTFHP